MDNKIIGRFIPVGKYNNGAKPFFVFTKEPSDYLAPAWKGIMSDGKEYHVIESAWEFEPIEWDGEGLPPVGCRVEANYGGEWVEATVAYTDRPDAHGDAVAWKEALVFDCKTTRPFWTDEFRPIRSEAEINRDEAVRDFVRQLIECVDLHATDKGKIDIVREKLYSMLPTLPGVTVID